MKMDKFISLSLVGIMCGTLLTGCGTSSTESIIKDYAPLTIEEVAGTRLVASTNQELESEIFQYVSDRIVVDGSKLIQPTSKDITNITNLLANINTQLQGKGGNTLSEEYANYLLLEFAKTPFEWQQSNQQIVGFDPAARLYFVDVTYKASKTTSPRKVVVPNSKIAQGDPEGNRLRQKRYADYVTMLAVKHSQSYNSQEAYVGLYNTFKNRWGNIDDIFDEQQGVSLYERTKREQQ